MTASRQFLLLALLSVLFYSSAAAQKLTPHQITLAGGKSFDLNLPDGFEISVAAQGLKRVRFMARSPDDRIFVTDMFNLTDNRRGVVYILDQFDPGTRQFKKITKYLIGLRNPNSVAFYTDQSGKNWFYLALTDRLLRYVYEPGKDAPSGEPEVLGTFPDYGLGYKYGGWHLTRTVVVGGNGKLYVAVGSSCNACEEREEVRASILEMDSDGKNQRYVARGLRNAVGLRWVKDRLYATNMGSDHLGPNRPADTFYSMTTQEQHFGWPYCYQTGRKVYFDPQFNAGGKKFDCGKVPVALVPFAAHSSPLGFEYFDSTNTDLADSFLVALHGSTRKSLGRGYRVVRIVESRPGVAEDFITGFFDAGRINGRPADVFGFEDGFLLTDDYSGVVYYVSRKHLVQ